VKKTAKAPAKKPISFTKKTVKKTQSFGSKSSYSKTKRSTKSTKRRWFNDLEVGLKKTSDTLVFSTYASEKSIKIVRYTEKASIGNVRGGTGRNP